MIVAIPRSNRSIGDDLDTALSPPSFQLTPPALLSTPSSIGSDALMVPSFASSVPNSPPVTPAASGSSFDWGSIIKPFTQGLTSGIFGTSRPAPAVLPPSSSSGSTALVVGGVALAAVLAVVLLRRPSAA